MVSKQHGTLHYNASEITAMGSGMGPGSGVVPVGGIIMWSGLLSAIPTGWHLCDGDAGTPDFKVNLLRVLLQGRIQVLRVEAQLTRILAVRLLLTRISLIQAEPCREELLE